MIEATRLLESAIANQALTSGTINAHLNDMNDTLAMASKELADCKIKFAQGIKLAKQTKKDLAELDARVKRLTELVQIDYPVEYQRALEENTT